ncbi:type I-F CRISPR-associated protein Csy2 [Pusillimonas sp. CC-YST705]|uniref:Type I-F CRISPR-associated protein Csy2 n=1 Tax=Mesopusillimonas faecipullorum TaxID=2755040 RepID=A0ABS8C9G1_9BURK|nr:type I-F CRISPR-associated protein Csy2 [Mesopusillimonas faecipullorum]MCB5362676.1 type I-F CRISPR-associated protein Csy2 [Mesopusillimonas faecipullorum]
MSRCPSHNFLVVLPHLRIQNANAVSSPLTHGFPSVTAFLGLMWALERSCRTQGLNLSFKAVGVVCHDHQEQSTHSGFVGSFCLTRNPVDKDGSTAAIVEEGRIHMDLSLILAVDCPHWESEPDAKAKDVPRIAQILSNMRIAGGSILASTEAQKRRHAAYVVDQSGNDDERKHQFLHARMGLLPGYALVARDDLLKSRFAELQASDASTTMLDAWLSFARINWRYEVKSSSETDGIDSAKAEKGEWIHNRAGQGWIVPIPVGYGALGELYAAGSVNNARDMETPFRFVESLYSIGQWLSPHRLDDPREMLWYADSNPDTGLYRCRNDYHPLSDLLDLQYDFD